MNKVIRKNKVIFKYFISITMTFILFFAFGCSKNEKVEIEESVEKQYTKYNAAVFQKNKNIYLYDKAEEYLLGIGDLSRFKELASISGGRQYIAYKYMDDTNIVTLYNINTNEYSTIDVNSYAQGMISNLKWINDNLVVEMYINPTTSKNLVYNLDKKQFINSCEGILIGIKDDGDTLVYGKSTNGITSIYVNDDKIYDIEVQGEVLLNGAVDLNSNKISLLTFKYDLEKGEQNEYFYEGILNKNTIDNVVVRKKPYDISGDIIYQNDKLYILGNDGVYYLQNTNFEPVDDKYIGINENSERLKNILKNTFKNENISVEYGWENIGVTNLTWFTR